MRSGMTQGAVREVTGTTSKSRKGAGHQTTKESFQDKQMCMCVCTCVSMRARLLVCAWMCVARVCVCVSRQVSGRVSGPISMLPEHQV